MSHNGSRSCGHQHPAIFVFIWMTAVYCASLFHCPQMVELGSSVNLTCFVKATSKAHSYTTPGGMTAATCSLSEGDCIPTGNFTASVINSTSSVLTIPKALETHQGVWKCVGNADDPYQETCRMSVVKIPTCEITSDQNISSITEGAMLTLAVNLTRSFCSVPSRIRLLTGTVSTSLNKGTGTDITPGVLTRNFNVTSSHFGDVSVLYTCHGDSRNVSCTGVKELVEGTLSGVTTSFTDSQPTESTSSVGPDSDPSHLNPHWRHIVGITVPLAVIIIVMIISVIYKIYKNYNRTTPENNSPQSPEEGHQMLQTSTNRREDVHEMDKM
ncbi:uncharacterized protein [Haliotis asinina]|uniref:uncharacterized protein n=1 Tax=Haliotis asinina TaxID=109174 RepID=UPI0035320194